MREDDERKNDDYNGREEAGLATPGASGSSGSCFCDVVARARGEAVVAAGLTGGMFPQRAGLCGLMAKKFTDFMKQLVAVAILLHQVESKQDTEQQSG